MLLISALALGLVESTSPNLSTSYSISNGNSGVVMSPHNHHQHHQHPDLSSVTAIGSHNGAISVNNNGEYINNINGTLKSTLTNTIFGDWSIEQCLIWHQGPNELYYQLGNAFFFLAFIAPHNQFGMLWLRSILIIGCVLMAIYGWVIECRPDVILWSVLFLSVNFIYLLISLCRIRPIRFDMEIEAIYESLFKPLRVSRQQFKKVLNCMKLIRSLKYQEVYAQEKVTKVDSLSLVLSGKLVVSQNQRALHIVFPHQFLDSPEWFGVSTDDFFQVSIMAMEESRVLIWHRDKLKLSIMAEPFLQVVFDHILGRDVVKKLMQVTQVSETMASNGFLPSGGYDDSEDKPMLCMKKPTDGGHGLTALINRQLQEEHAPLLGRPQPKRIRLVSSSAASPVQRTNPKIQIQDWNTSNC